MAEIVATFIARSPNVNVVIALWSLALASATLIYAVLLRRRNQIVILDYYDLALAAFALLPIALFRLGVLFTNDFTISVLGSRIGNLWTLVMLTLVALRHYLILSNWRDV